MRFLRHAALLAAVLGQAAQAQVSTPPGGATLTLDEAIAIARRNNPTFLQTVNARRDADAQVRSARGGLLPSADASLSGRFQQGGQQVFNGLSFSSSSDALQSSYSLGLTYQMNGAKLLAPRQAVANRNAAEADVSGASELLRSTVTQQYLTALQAEARAALQDTLVATAAAQLELAKAKTAVGAGTALDVRRAEVALGQAQVQALTAKNTAAVEKLHLFQDLGVARPDSVQLTTRFAVAEPTFSLDSVLDLARRANPAVSALRAREKASNVSVRMAQAQYTPSLTLSTGWGGQTYQYTNPDFLINNAQAGAAQQYGNCVTFDSLRAGAGLAPTGGCGSPTLTSAQIQAIRDKNNTFPFRFDRSPFSLFASFSLPIFDNFNREQRVEEAQVAKDNAQLNLRARELQLTADVTQAYLSLTTAARTVALQEQTAQKAREELAFAEERYRVGAATFLDVTTARSEFEQAQIDRVNAIYDYHKAFAALESAVGRPLR